MRDDAQLNSAWQVRVTAKRELMRTIEDRGAEITVWVRIVERLRPEVLVGHGGQSRPGLRASGARQCEPTPLFRPLGPRSYASALFWRLRGLARQNSAERHLAFLEPTLDLIGRAQYQSRTGRNLSHRFHGRRNGPGSVAGNPRRKL